MASDKNYKDGEWGDLRYQSANSSEQGKYNKLNVERSQTTNHQGM